MAVHPGPGREAYTAGGIENCRSMPPKEGCEDSLGPLEVGVVALGPLAAG
jgi:hypothetical protein